MTVTYFAPIGTGIGDVVVSMPIIQWLIKTHPQVFLVARSPRQLGFEERIAGISGGVREVDLHARLTADDTYINLRDHPLQTNYDWWSEEFRRDYPNFLINDILKTIALSYGIDADLNSFPRFITGSVPSLSEQIVFVPGTTADFKSWPVAMWLALHHYVRQVLGADVVVLGEDRRIDGRSTVVADLIDSGVKHLQTPEIGDAIDVLTNAAAVVAVDTGLMHIAVQQGTPTVALFNHEHTYYRPASHCYPVFSPPCARSCHEAAAALAPFPVHYPKWQWWGGQFASCRRPSETGDSQCMSSLSLAPVIDSLNLAWQQSKTIKQRVCAPV